MSDLPPIAVIGNANLDLVGGLMDHWPERGTESFLDHADSRIGGSAANTALVLQRLAVPFGLIASSGSDIVGNVITGQFSGPLDRITITPGPSSVTFGVLHPGSERTFFSTPGHLDHFTTDQVRNGLKGWPLKGAMALVSGSFALPGMLADCTALLRELKVSGARTVIDPGWPGEGWSEQNRAYMRDWIAHSDVILLNDKEILGLTGARTVNAAMNALTPDLCPGAALVVKCGPDGALCRQNEQDFSAASPNAEIFDTIGAGDAFNAGCLAALQAGYGPAGCLSAGCTIASTVIRHFPRATDVLSLPDDITPTEAL